jgi:hypothetical protein
VELDAKVKNDLDRGEYLAPDAGRITLKVYGDQWLAAQTFDASPRESVELRLRLRTGAEWSPGRPNSLRPSVMPSPTPIRN